jgi:uncharacterized repeat protein (TIGR01451 family)
VRKLSNILRAAARTPTARRRAVIVVAVALTIVFVEAGIVWAGDAAKTTDGARAAAISRNGARAPSLPKQVGRHVFVGHSYKNDVSRSLRVVPAAPHKPSRERAIPALKIRHSHSRATAPDGARQSKAFAPKMPSPILNFDGIPFPGVNCDCAPPDTNGEVGLTQYVQIVNQGFEVYNKTTGTSVFGPVDIATVWSGFGGPCEDDAWGDPVVLYDQLANRWVISQFAGLDTYGAMTDECVAVSTTSDATGSWNRYGFHLGTDFFDYPKLGVWPDAYYMSMNVFDGDTEAFLGPQPFALDRTAMLSGDPATFVTFRDSSFFNPSSDPFMPADLDGLTPPPAGAPNPFLSTGVNSTWPLYRFHVDFATPANSTFTSGGTLTPATFSPICGGGACVPQLNGELLDTLGDRGMFRSAYRNYGDHEALVGNMTIASSGVAGVRWFEVNNTTSGVPAFTQQGTQQPDSTWRWMGSAAMDNDGDLAVGYSASSGSLHPSIRYAGRLAGDPLGQLSQGEATLFTGAGSQQTNTFHRWGDYSDMTIDPVDDCTFWYTQEYYATTAPFHWSTRIGNFKFPSCTSPSGAHVTVAKAADDPSVFEGDPIGFTVELANDGADAATGLTFTDNLPGGTGVDWSIETPVSGWSITGSAPNQHLVYTPTTLASGTATQVHIVSDTTSDSCGTLQNTASFTSTNGGSGSASDSTTVGCVTIAKTADASSVSAGSQIGFTVSLTNVSPTVDAAGVTVTDPLPSGTGVDWSIATADSGWSLTGSPPNETLTYSATLFHNSTSQVHVVSATGSQSCSDYFNTASFTSTDEGSGEASADEFVFGCPAVFIYKAADANTIPAGALMGFNVEMDNFGDADAIGLTFTDPLPAGSGVSWVVDAANSTAGWSISGSPPNQSLVYSPTVLAADDFVYVHIVSATNVAGCGTYNNTAQFGSSNAGTGSASDSVNVVGCALLHTLTVNKSGSGVGTVTSSPPGVNCGPVCSLQFANGLGVTLTAAASSGSRFAGWSGDCSGTATTCALTMSADHNVTATFAKKPKCKVPKVVGLTLAKAKGKIRTAHCGVGKIRKKFSSRKKKGHVLSQKPKPGKTLPAGSKVNLTVGKGPKK